MTPPNPAPPSSASASAADSFLNDTAFVTPLIGEVVNDVPTGAAEANPQPQPDFFPPELIQGALAGTFDIIFGMIAERRGEHWLLKPFEKDGLAKGWTPLVNYYLSMLGSHETKILSLAVMATAPVVAGKMFQDAMKRGSSTENTRTPKSGAESASSARPGAAKPPEPSEPSWGQSE